MDVNAVILLVGLATLVAALLGWAEARARAPFAVTAANAGVFGVERTRYWPVVVASVFVPHHVRLPTANEAGYEGPFDMGRGDQIFLTLEGAEPPVDVVVQYRNRWGRKERYWTTHVL